MKPGVMWRAVRCDVHGITYRMRAMTKVFCRHSECIESSLREISERYPEKRMICDVGCGDGTRTVLFERDGRTIYGVDRVNWLSEGVKGKIILKQEDFINSTTSFGDKFFDIVLSFDVIEHLPEPTIMLREIFRILKDDGVLVISTPNRHRLLAYFLYLFRLRKLPYLPDENTKDTDPYAYHVIEYTDRELQNLLAREGFDVARKHKLFYGLTGRYGISELYSLPLYHNIIFECRKRV